jgi:hypothetical protein
VFGLLTWGVVVAYFLALVYDGVADAPAVATAADALFAVVWIVLGGRYLAENKRTPLVVTVAGLLIVGGVGAGYTAFAPNPVVEQSVAELPILLGLVLYFYRYFVHERS